MSRQRGIYQIGGNQELSYLDFAKKELANRGYRDASFIILDDDLDKKLSWKDVIKMSKNKLTEFGGHSHNHNILGHLSKSNYHSEIKKSLNFLSSKAKLHIKHYSYPEGFNTSFNEDIIKILKRNKIKTCVTTLNKNFFKKNYLLKLSRHFVF